jgi:hypothetical protein
MKTIPIVKGMTNMDSLNQYIDLCLIDEYAEKSFTEGYSLDVDSIPEHDRSNFLDELMRHDTTVRDLVLYHMQKLIDERLPECEVKDRQNAGLRLIHLSNGDTMLVRERGYL